MARIDIVDAAVTAEQIQPFITNPLHFKFGWPSNIKLGPDQGHWNYTFTKYVSIEKEIETALQATDLSVDLDPVYQPFWDATVSLFGPRRLCRGYFNGYTYGTDAYLHRDVDYSKFPADRECNMETVLFYLNDEWDPNYGGETVFVEKENIIKSVLPKQGRAICFDSNIYHGARPLSRKCFKLRQVLVFKTAVDTYPEKAALDFIYKLTYDVPHSGMTLFEHLSETYQIMITMGFPRYACLAGLYHSVYDTEFFNAGLNISREEVKSLIGEKAEGLVYQFCTLRPRKQHILASDTDNQYALAAIEYANLIQQSERIRIDGAYVSALKNIIKK
jgi:hypothetical protein